MEKNNCKLGDRVKGWVDLDYGYAVGILTKINLDNSEQRFMLRLAKNRNFWCNNIELFKEK